MRTRIITTAALLAGGLLSTSSHARPFRTDAAGTTAPSAIEVELGSDWWTDKAGFGFNIKQGITQRLDLGFHIPYAAIPDSTRAFGNATIAAKFDIVPGAAALDFTSALGGSSYALNGVVTKSWDAFKTSIDLGGSVTTGARDADLTWGVNPSWTVGPTTLGAELRGDQHQANWWQVGTQVKILGGIAVDVGLGDDFKDGHDWHVATGIWIPLLGTK